MDESLSWRARLAKSNINILNVTMVKTDHGVINRWFVEFTYHPKLTHHPKPGTFKWCKTYIDIPQKVEDDEDNPLAWKYVDQPVDEMAQIIMDKVLELRKELEG